MAEPVTIAHELAKIPAKYWVALTLDESRVVFYARTLDEAIAGAAQRGVDDPLMLKIPDNDILVP